MSHLFCPNIYYNFDNGSTRNLHNLNTMTKSEMNSETQRSIWIHKKNVNENSTESKKRVMHKISVDEWVYEKKTEENKANQA